MQLGIVHQRITPGRPRENGAHERMHRELKRETTRRPPAQNLRGKQRKFDFFRERYNDERPHDALDGARPSDRREPSPRPYPERIAPRVPRPPRGAAREHGWLLSSSP
jgi:transposase InsO family protein